ncbi:MAG: FlgD immunoglobulin-like domain containing protein [Candidatus Eisenbacteria bacterium]
MERRPTRLIAFLVIAVIGVTCIGGEALAGLNTNAKIAVHVRPHVSGSCTKNFPTIATCGDITTTDPGISVDAFPVFYDMVEYQGFDYGMTFTSGYSCTFTSCSDLTIGGIVASGTGVSHAWYVCQYAPVAICGFGWIYSYGTICIVPHPEAGGPKVGDCHLGDDFPADNACAGTNGILGDDPCEQPPVCEIDPTTLDFGTITFGDPPVQKTFEIRNTGGGLLEGTLSEMCDHFAITNPLGGGAYSVANGTPLVVTVEYDPTIGGYHNCTIDTDTPCADDDVSCTGEAITPVSVDIRPGTCPNDLRVESPFMIPVAILGTASFDVSQVDAANVQLTRQGVAGSVSPVRWAQTDVATPFTGTPCDCHATGGDGLVDLNLKFRISEVVTALELDAVPGQTVELMLTGTYTPGPLFAVGPKIEGSDCVRVVSGLSGDDVPGPGFDLITHGKKSGDTVIMMSFSTNSEDHVALEIFDVRGRLVTRLVDEVRAPGTYEQTWDMVDDAGHRVPAGVYFARLKNSVEKETAKIVIAN